MFSRNYLQIKEGNSVWFHEIFFKKRRGNSLMYSRNFYWRKKKKCVYGTEILTFTKFLYKKKKTEIISQWFHEFLAQQKRFVRVEFVEQKIRS